MNEMISTSSGLIVGCECSTCWTRWSGRLAAARRTARPRSPVACARSSTGASTSGLPCRECEPSHRAIGVSWRQWLAGTAGGHDRCVGRYAMRPAPPAASAQLVVAPADLAALVAGDAVHAVDRLVGHQGHTGVEEVQARGVVGWRLAAVGDTSRSPRRRAGPSYRVLLRRGVDDAGLDLGHALATAVDRHDGRRLARPP